MECDLSSTMLHYLDEYIVNVRAETTKGHSPWANLTFCPYKEAKIGPPGVWLESINGNEKINILHPEANQSRKMWESDNLSYTLTIWKNSSHPEEKIEPVFPGQFIHGLEPETTYCLKVNAHLIDNIGLNSAVYCKRTPKAWTGLPIPENLRVHALNMKCILYWDTLNEGNVSYLVQYLLGHNSRASLDISKNWANVTGCKNVQTAHCDISSSVSFDGIYYFQVQAVHNDKKSPWSKMQQFEPQKDNQIGSPSIKVNASEESLLISIASPGETENNPMSKLYKLTYSIWYWPNSSYTKKKELGDRTSPPYVISGLIPSTLYCLKVQAFSRQYNKSSMFSNVECIETAKGESLALHVIIIIAITIAIGVVVAGLIGFTYYIGKKVKYAFFPKCSPPLTIKSIEGKDVSSSYLLTSEEPKEDCVVIVDSSAPNDVNLVDVKDHKELEEISQDSGNYSNHDDISGDKDSCKITEQKAT
ncbi:interferon alpha/beta receptor 1 isoform X2 [Sceloporus undulatus]|nr:interferon alpha/beta receptor 1 isoform X2 [Sceloporus undulatus]